MLDNGDPSMIIILISTLINIIIILFMLSDQIQTLRLLPLWYTTTDTIRTFFGDILLTSYNCLLLANKSQNTNAILPAIIFNVLIMFTIYK